MAIGLPVISTNCLSGPLEILNDNEQVNIDKGNFFIASHGILINVGDREGLKKAINYVMSNKTFLREYSFKSLERAKEYSLDNIYIKLNHLIENARCN